MRLLLTSSGLSTEKIKQFFVSRFDRLDNKTAALIVAKRPGERRDVTDRSRKELEDRGVKVQEIDITRDDIYANYPDFDIYYVCGGNTFFVLDRMRATGMEKILTDAVNKDKFYVGANAGSMIAGPDIETAKTIGDINDIGLQNLGGFHFVPFLILPHYAEDKKNKFIDFKRYRFQEPVIALTDNQALYIDGKESVLIGGRGGLQFCEGCKLKDLTE